MKKMKKIIFFLLIIPQVLAQGIGISPSSIEIETFPGGEGEISLRIFNLGKKNFTVEFQGPETLKFPKNIFVKAKKFEDVTINYSISQWTDENILTTIIARANQTGFIQSNAEFKIFIEVSEEHTPQAKIRDAVFGIRTRAVVENIGETNSTFRLFLDGEEKKFRLLKDTDTEIIFEKRGKKLELYAGNLLLDIKSKPLFSGMLISSMGNKKLFIPILIIMILGIIVFKRSRVKIT